MTEPLFSALAGTSYREWPPALKEFHDPRPHVVARGPCEVKGPATAPGRLLARLLALPRSTPEAVMTFAALRTRSGEFWLRTTPGHRFVSHLALGGDGRLVERMGPLAFRFDVEGNVAGFDFALRRVTFLGVPLPRALWPRIAARERFAEGDVRFDVSSSLPFVGHMMSYRGALRPIDAGPDEIPGRPLLLFDGYCRFCNKGVDFFLEHDADERIRFAPIQSDLGGALRSRYGLATETFETLVVLDGGEVYARSAAVLHLLDCLPWPWRALRVIRLVPRPVRDWTYRQIAARRYRFLGKRATCRLPTSEQQRRFV